MKNLINCGTCGYPLTPEERTTLVEKDGVMVKPAPVQEPVAWRAWFDADNGARWLFSLWPEEERLDVEWQPLFTSPPAQRQWVGLTEKEILECRSANHLHFYLAIQAKLKEKNT